MQCYITDSGDTDKPAKKEDIHAPPKNIGDLKLQEKVSDLFGVCVCVCVCVCTCAYVCVFASVYTGITYTFLKHSGAVCQLL